MTLLSVTKLQVAFGTEQGTALVLDEVSMDVSAGEIMGLVGESGCGKTTLARAVLGVLPPNARVLGGGIRFGDDDLLAMPPAEAASRIRGQAITFVPQDPLGAFSPLFTIGDQMLELMRWKRPPEKGRGEHREEILDMLRLVQLPDPEGVLRKYPHELSGGQRQRIMIAMALLPQPRLIIADEPTTAIDVTIQAQILKLLRQLATERGVSVLFTTHDLGTAWEICDRITVLYAGQELETAPVAEFFERPRVPYTGLLLDNLPARGSLKSGIPGEIPSPLLPPGGCRFNPRCPNASPICAAKRPGVTEPVPGHEIRCHHPL